MLVRRSEAFEIEKFVVLACGKQVLWRLFYFLKPPPLLQFKKWLLIMVSFFSVVFLCYSTVDGYDV